MDTTETIREDAPTRNQPTGAHPVDNRLRALIAPLRRRAVRHLGAADGACTLAELVRACADHPTDAGIVETKLVHTHLPQLARANAVEFNPTYGTVTRGVDFDAVRDLLFHVDDHCEAVDQPDLGGELL